MSRLVAVVQVVLIQFAELRRWQDYRKPGSMGKQFFLGFENVLQGSGEPAYPGAHAGLNSNCYLGIICNTSLRSHLKCAMAPTTCCRAKRLAVNRAHHSERIASRMLLLPLLTAHAWLQAAPCSTPRAWRRRARVQR